MTDDQVLEAIEVAKSTGKLKKGSNEATKAVEKSTAKLVAIAKDTEPKEIVMHIPLLCKEKGIPCFEIATKEELGGAAGIQVGTTAIAIIAEGEAKALIEKLSANAAPEPKAVAKPAEEKPETEKKKEEKKEEPKAEEKKQAPKEEKPAEEPKEEKKAEESKE